MKALTERLLSEVACYTYYIYNIYLFYCFNLNDLLSFINKKQVFE